jgi:hypothetical protein
MGSMSPHLPGKHSEGKDEEREHFSPDYLRGIQSEFTDGLPSPVEVIGEDLAATDYNPYRQVDDQSTVRPAGYTSSSVPGLPDPHHATASGVSDNRPDLPAAQGFQSSRRDAPLYMSEPNPATSTRESAPVAKNAEPEASPADTTAEVSDGFSGSGLDLHGLFAEYGEAPGTHR